MKKLPEKSARQLARLIDDLLERTVGASATGREGTRDTNEDLAWSSEPTRAEANSAQPAFDAADNLHEEDAERLHMAMLLWAARAKDHPRLWSGARADETGRRSVAGQTPGARRTSRLVPPGREHRRPSVSLLHLMGALATAAAVLVVFRLVFVPLGGRIPQPGVGAAPSPQAPSSSSIAANEDEGMDDKGQRPTDGSGQQLGVGQGTASAFAPTADATLVPNEFAGAGPSDLGGSAPAGPFPMVQPDNPLSAVKEIAFSPDGSEIAFVVHKGFTAGPADAFAVPVTGAGILGGQPRRLGIIDDQTFDALADSDPSESISDVAASLPSETVVAVESIQSSAAAGMYALSVLRAGDFGDGISSDVLLVTPDGAEVRNLTRGRFHVTGVTWAPDGRVIALWTSEPFKLVFLDARTGTEVASTDPPFAVYGGPGGHVVFSPDGQTVAIAESGLEASSIELYDIPTGERRLLAETAEPDGSTQLVEYGPMQFTSDGQELLYFAQSDTSGDDPVVTLHRLPVTAQATVPAAVVELPSYPVSVSNRLVNRVDWMSLAPDDLWILLRRADAVWGLYLPTGELRRITPEAYSVWGTPAETAAHTDRLALEAQDASSTTRILIVDPIDALIR